MGTKHRPHRKSELQRAAEELRARAKAAAKKAAAGTAKQKHEAAELAHLAADKTREANRQHFLNMARAYARTAYTAIDKISQLCERRKYRVVADDQEIILKPLKHGVEDLADALTIACKRKNVWPSDRQVGSDPADNLGGRLGQKVA